MGGNIIICGAPRAATTSFYRHLCSHPQIVSSEKKELNYFLGYKIDKDAFSDDMSRPESYKEKFPNMSEGDWTLEASPIYMHPEVSGLVARRIKQTVPNAVLVFLLRDPVSRFYSHFNVDKRAKRIPAEMNISDYMVLNSKQNEIETSENVEKLIDPWVALEIGKYEQSISTYLNYFDKSQIYYVFTETLKIDAKTEMNRICSSLNISSDCYSSYSFYKENEYRYAKNNDLYLLAGKINTRFEGLLNAVPSLRRVARSFYNAVNTNSDSKTSVTSKDIEALNLKAFYKNHNYGLKMLLQDTQPSIVLPKWLS